MENSDNDHALLDVVIAVHTADRPIERAVASLIVGGLPTDPGARDRLRITVVCHNTEVEPIRARVLPEHRDRVRFLHLADGIKSPAGPFNRGLAEANAVWVAIMGSDDSIEPGALARWVEAASGADVLLAPMAHASGGTIRTPVVRPRRRQNLDPVKDRLSYRTAPLGLLRLSLLRKLGLSFPTKYATGEDQSFSARLWFSGADIRYGRSLPRYLVHDDAALRVTETARPVSEDLAFATDLVATEWFAGLETKQREALVTKLIRIHVFAHLTLRAAAGRWNAEDADQLAAALQQLVFRAPGAIRPLSIADRVLLDAIISRSADHQMMHNLATARREFRSPRTWIPRDLSQLLHPEAPLRFISASVLL